MERNLIRVKKSQAIRISSFFTLNPDVHGDNNSNNKHLTQFDPSKKNQHEVNYE